MTTADRSPEQLRLSYEVSKNAQIVSMWLTESELRRPAHESTQQYKPEVGSSVRDVCLHPEGEQSFVFVTVKYTFAAVPVTKSSDDANTTVYVSASFAVRYLLKNGIGQVTEDHLNAFGSLNGVYNTYPYWREFLQSSLYRMNLPPYVLPLLPPSPPKSAPPVQSDQPDLEAVPTTKDSAVRKRAHSPTIKNSGKAGKAKRPTSE